MYSEKMVKKLNQLKTAIKTASNKGGVRMAVEMADINQALSEFLDALNEDDQKQAEEESEAEDEEEAQRATYDLHHRRLIGLAEEIRPLARKRPDSPCNTYKLQQVNEVLSLLKEELDVCFNADLALADEDAALSYSDVSFLLRAGLIARTVPDKPNSRNQKYLTARTV